MYPVTEAVAALFDANQPQVLRITGTDANGVAINITEANVMSGGFSIDRYCNNGTKLELGTAVSAELTLKLNNADGTFNGTMFEGAELFVEVGIADWSQDNPTMTWIPCGYFTPDEQPRNRTIITLSALDRMMNFDTTVPTLSPWTTDNGATMRDNMGNVLYFCADLVFPATVSSLVEQLCARCSVPFTQNISTLPNGSFVVQEAPKLQQDFTFRNLIQWCAGIMGTNAIINYNGELQFLWYGTSGYNTTPDRRYSSDLYENDITVTGITYTDANQQTYLAGSDSYALDISSNYLLTDLDDTSISAVLTAIYATLTGFTYRPFEAKVMPAPWLFPMDRVTFTDLAGNTHISLLTNVNTTINGATVLKACGETSKTNSYAAPSGLTPQQTNALRRVLASSNEQLEAAIADATNQITGATNSNVKFVYNEQGGLSEILVMDSPNIETAVNVWRWNSAGLGHSSNGYNGTYSLAMTQSGSIVATMITTGILNASLMKAGIIQDVNGLNYWNMATGDFKLNANTVVEDTSGTTPTTSTIASQADVTALDNSLDQQDIFNRLTNNGQTQGIYLQNGLLYINGSYIQAGAIDGDLITAGVITGRKQDGTSHVYKTEYDLVNAKLTVSNIYYTDQTQQTVDYQWSTVFEDGGISFYYNGTKIGYITAAEVNGTAQIRLYGNEIQVVAPSTSYVAEVKVTDDTVQISAADIELYADNVIRYNGSALYTGLISIDGQYLDVENGLIRSFS